MCAAPVQHARKVLQMTSGILHGLCSMRVHNTMPCASASRMSVSARACTRSIFPVTQHLPVLCGRMRFWAVLKMPHVHPMTHSRRLSTWIRMRIRIALLLQCSAHSYLSKHKPCITQRLWLCVRRSSMQRFRERVRTLHMKAGFLARSACMRLIVRRQTAMTLFFKLLRLCKQQLQAACKLITAIVCSFLRVMYSA